MTHPSFSGLNADPTSRTLLLGLDGVSWDLIDELRTEASVPTLDELASASVHGVTSSTIPSLTCPALPAMYTGLNPGNLGIFDFVKPSGDIVDYHDVIEPAIWDYLSGLDISMVVGAMRTTHPAPEIEGVFISDVLSPAEESAFITPESDRELGERFHRLRDELERRKKAGRDDDLLETFVQMNDERINVFQELLEREDPAFALLWFGLADGVQHYFWDDREQLYRFFEAFDDRLAELLDRFPNANIVVTGDHGFGPALERKFHLNEWLRRNGYLELRGGPVRRTATGLSYLLSERYTSDRVKRIMLSTLDRFRGVTDGGDTEGDEGGTNENDDRIVVSPLNSLPGIDWDRTTAHASTRKGWGVTIRRKNVDAGYEAFRDRLIRDLERIESPYGDPAIKAAWRGEEIYWGRYADQIPDVIVLPHDKLKIRPSVPGSLYSPQDSGSYVGSHESAREAVFMASGPDIDGGVDSVGHLDIYDIAPILFALLGLPVPDHFDGGLPKRLLADESAVRRAGYPVERHRIRKALRGVASTL